MLQNRFNGRLAALVLVTAMCSGSVSAETLQEAWQAALAVDYKLEASQWRSSAAQRGLYAARAERCPSLDAKAKYYVYDNPLAIRVPLPFGINTQFDLTQREGLLGSLQLTQPVFTFGRIRSGIDAAGAEVTAAVSDETRTELDVRLGVAEAYTNVLRVQRGIEVAERAVESLTSHARDIKNRLDQGVGIRADLLAAEVALADAQQVRLQAYAGLDIARAAYNRALQRPLDSPVDLEELSEPVGEYDLNCLTDQALGQRPEIAYLSAKVRALRNQARSIRAAKLPQLAVQGSFEYLENRFFVREGYTSVAMVGEWNMLDMGRKRHKAMQLEQTAEALLRERSDAESFVMLQVRQAWRNLNTLRERVAVNRAAVKSAEENVAVTKNRYNQGVGTNTEVLDAETLRTQTYSNFYNSLYDSVFALMSLSRAVGDFSLSDQVSQSAPTDAPAQASAAPLPPFSG
jgi:outer membrane protein TolC